MNEMQKDSLDIPNPNQQVAKIIFDGGDIHIPADLRSKADFTPGGEVDTILEGLRASVDTAIAIGATSLTAIRKPGERPFIRPRVSEPRITSEIDWA